MRPIILAALALAACTPAQVAQTVSAAKQAIVTGQLVCASGAVTAAMADASGAPLLASALASGAARTACGYINAVPVALPQAAADVLAQVPMAVRPEASERMGIMTLPPMTPRVISTAGLRRFDIGNGAVIYTNNPEAVVAFSYNTGSASGSVTGPLR